MKKQKRHLILGVIMASLFLSGCGTQLYEMTKEEEDLIVYSAAHLVAKHNIQQKDGLSATIDKDTISAGKKEDETVENIQEPETELAEEVFGPATDAVGEKTDMTAQTSGVSLAELIGHGTDLEISYTGSYVAAHYIEGSAYSVDAKAGKSFYVMQFTITNPTETDVTVDNVTRNPIFQLVSDAVTTKSEVTFLTTDFSTYQGVIGAGESVETILLFEVSEAAAEQITAPSLKITVGNETKSIKL